MTVFNRKLLADPEPKYTDDDEVLMRLNAAGAAEPVAPAKPEDPYDAWVKAHPQGIDLGDNSRELEIARAARRQAKGVKVGRPAMPEDKPRGFTSLEALAPREGAPEVVDSRPKVAGERTDEMPAAKPHDDMLDAELMASGRRTRAGMQQAARVIGRAGLAKNPQSAQADAQELAAADLPVQELKGRRAETRARAQDARELEDQTFQRNADTRGAEQHGLAMEKGGRERDYNSPTSGVSARRRSELIGLYGKQVAKIPLEDFKQLSAADVDVLMKELSQEKDRGLTRAGMAQQNAFLRRLDALGKGSQQFGEVDQLEQDLERLAPGITTGKAGAGSEMGTMDKIALALPGGVGERFTSQNTAELNRALDNLTAQVGYLRSGKVVTEPERQNLRRVLGLQVGQDPQRLAAGVSAVMRELRQRQQQFQGGYGDPAGAIGGRTPLDAAEGNGVSTFRQHGHAPPAGHGGGGRVVTMPDGTKWRELPDGSAEQVR